MRHFSGHAFLVFVAAIGVYFHDDNRPRPLQSAEPPTATKEKPRAVSQESVEYLQKLRKNTPFGTDGFDLEALRAGMGSRREPKSKDIKLIRVKVGDLPCEWVVAPGADPGVRLLYIHGGGFVSGSGGFYLTLAAHLSAAANCAVLLPDYRLAPEHRFPAGLEDCIRAHEWMIANGPSGPAPARATFVAGDSAGGSLTLATLLALRDRKLPLPAGGIPLSPTTDLTLASESLKTVMDPIISAKTMPIFRDHYLGKKDPRDPLASPVFGDYRGIPPLLIHVGEHEMLLDDSIRVAKKASSDGIAVKLEVWPGMFHVFQSHEPLLPEAKESIEHIADFLRSLSPPPVPSLTPIVRTADLNVGELQEIELAGGKKITVKLLDLKEVRDELRNAVRKAEVAVEVGGQKLTMVSANYRLPVTIAGVQIDCPITKGYCERSSKENPWGLAKDARIRLWPAESPLMNPGTFRYPAKQRWFASGTQMANEPVYVDGGEIPGSKSIYYHYGLDIGGAEGMVEVVAATDGVVVSSGKEAIPDLKKSPVSPRYDVVYLLDARGWYYRYSHLHTIDPSMKLGATVKMGQRVGLLGKEGGSGGWSHLHFDISARQPSGNWGIVDGYAFLWEAYLHEHKPKLLAVARPHHIANIGEKVVLDGSRSWSSNTGKPTFEWTFTDGKTASGAHVERTYTKPGIYSEILKFTDGAGRVDFDFAVVHVLDKEHPDKLPPSIHAAYYPTFGIKPGDNVTFTVRSFRTIEGKETWDFGDGSPKEEVRSDGNAVQLAKDGYARTIHRYEKPGHYLVRVERTNSRGETAVARLQVRVGIE